MEKGQLFYKTTLERYSEDMRMSGFNSYYGAPGDYRIFMKFLNFEYGSDRFYRQTIDAYYEYLSGNKKAKHRVGMEDLPIFEEYRLIAFKDWKIENYQDNYITQLNREIEVRVDTLLIREVALTNGKIYARCLKPDFIGLSYSFGSQWVIPEDSVAAYPETIETDSPNFSMRLYIEEEAYDSEKRLMEDLRSGDKIDLREFLREIIES